jgi:hypothetical protein
VQIAAASLWLKGKALCPEMQPEQLNLVAPNLRLADLPVDDPALVELRSDIEAETGIAGEFTSQILQALQGADHLGSLLKIDQAVDSAIEQQEHRLKALRAKAIQVQADLFGGVPPLQEEMDFSAVDARADLQELLEQFLTRHSSANDLGLRLHGEQLAAGVRFVRMLKDGEYDLIVANPPYQDSGKMTLTSYVERNYILGKANRYAAFMLRGLELVKPSGLSAMLTMRSWMFLKQYAELRENLLNSFALNSILDLSSGAFEEISAAQVIVSVAASIFIRLADMLSPANALKVFDDETVTSIGETHRKRAATIAQEGFYNFNSVDLKVVPEWPIVYWWDNRLLAAYQSASVFGEIAPCKAAQSTGDNTRFTRYVWEIPGQKSILNSHSKSKWCPLVKGAAGAEWIDPVTYVVHWGPHGLPIKAYKCNQSGVDTCGLANEDYYLGQRPFAWCKTRGPNALIRG